MIKLCCSRTRSNAIYPLLNPPAQYFTTSVSQTPIVYFVVTHFGIRTIYRITKFLKNGHEAAAPKVRLYIRLRSADHLILSIGK